jgi:hypothetical protein
MMVDRNRGMEVDMKRRLYFLFPDVPSARAAVRDLGSIGVDRVYMHAVARDDVDVGDLPPATSRQRHDLLRHVERTLWDGNLAVFGLAFAGLIISLGYNSKAGMVLAGAVMIVTFVSGALFALRTPSTHLDEFRAALHHGEILLMVDVTRDCMEDVEEYMRRLHPDAVTGGSAWTPDAFGV